jgi:hypothetical protein
MAKYSYPFIDDEKAPVREEVYRAYKQEAVAIFKPDA